MPKMLVMEVYSVEADSPDAALNQAKTNSRNPDAVFAAADQLGGLLNPYHFADAQQAFGAIKPTESEAPAEADVDG